MTLSLSSPPVAGVWWAHTLDCLYDSLSSPPVAGVWWAHTLDWLYDSLSSPPVAGVWWAHTLDWLYDSLSSPPVAGVWWVHTLDWLYDSLSSPPVATVWWAHWRRCTLLVVEERPPPHMIVKRFGCTTIHNKALYKCIIHSFIHSNNFPRKNTEKHNYIWRALFQNAINAKKNKKWVRHAILLCTEPIHCSINVSCQIAIFPCLKCTARCSSFPNRYKRRTCF